MKQPVTIRFILSVIAGLATSMALSMSTRLILHFCGVFPPPFEPIFEPRLVVISLITHSCYAVVGAFVTALTARDKARKAAFFLGSKEAVMWLLGLILLWKHAPVWYTITKAVIGIPLALFGGWLYQKYRIHSGNPEKKDTSIKIVDLFKILISKFR